MNKDLQDAQKKMVEARAQKERETLRDMLAMTAMGALISSQTRHGKDAAIYVAERAYEYADYMLIIKGEGKSTLPT